MYQAHTTNFSNRYSTSIARLMQGDRLDEQRGYSEKRVARSEKEFHERMRAKHGGATNSYPGAPGNEMLDPVYADTDLIPPKIFHLPAGPVDWADLVVQQGCDYYKRRQIMDEGGAGDNSLHDLGLQNIKVQPAVEQVQEAAASSTSSTSSTTHLGIKINTSEQEKSTGQEGPRGKQMEDSREAAGPAFRVDGEFSLDAELEERVLSGKADMSRELFQRGPVGERFAQELPEDAFDGLVVGFQNGRPVHRRRVLQRAARFGNHQYQAALVDAFQRSGADRVVFPPDGVVDRATLIANSITNSPRSGTTTTTGTTADGETRKSMNARSPGRSGSTHHDGPREKQQFQPAARSCTQGRRAVDVNVDGDKQEPVPQIMMDHSKTSNKSPAQLPPPLSSTVWKSAYFAEQTARTEKITASFRKPYPPNHPRPPGVTPEVFRTFCDLGRIRVEFKDAIFPRYTGYSPTRTLLQEVMRGEEHKNEPDKTSPAAVFPPVWNNGRYTTDVAAIGAKRMIGGNKTTTHDQHQLEPGGATSRSVRQASTCSSQSRFKWPTGIVSPENAQELYRGLFLQEPESSAGGVAGSPGGGTAPAIIGDLATSPRRSSWAAVQLSDDEEEEDTSPESSSAARRQFIPAETKNAIASPSATRTDRAPLHISTESKNPKTLTCHITGSFGFSGKEFQLKYPGLRLDGRKGLSLRRIKRDIAVQLCGRPGVFSHLQILDMKIYDPVASSPPSSPPLSPAAGDSLAPEFLLIRRQDEAAMELTENTSSPGATTDGDGLADHDKTRLIETPAAKMKPVVLQAFLSSGAAVNPGFSPPFQFPVPDVREVQDSGGDEEDSLSDPAERVVHHDDRETKNSSGGPATAPHQPRSRTPAELRPTVAAPAPSSAKPKDACVTTFEKALEAKQARLTFSVKKDGSEQKSTSAGEGGPEQALPPDEHEMLQTVPRKEVEDPAQENEDLLLPRREIHLQLQVITTQRLELTLFGRRVPDLITVCLGLASDFGIDHDCNPGKKIRMKKPQALRLEETRAAPAGGEEQKRTEAEEAENTRGGQQHLEQPPPPPRIPPPQRIRKTTTAADILAASGKKGLSPPTSKTISELPAGVKGKNFYCVEVDEVMWCEIPLNGEFADQRFSSADGSSINTRYGVPLVFDGLTDHPGARKASLEEHDAVVVHTDGTESRVVVQLMRVRRDAFSRTTQVGAF
ncbi:unnamed protein product [Amoebophrya sp. A120]|nr:unnamed protein product [Amoebophrya sp. A120]|eukprot:GSA120T00024854001.1